MHTVRLNDDDFRRRYARERQADVGAWPLSLRARTGRSAVSPTTEMRARFLASRANGAKNLMEADVFGRRLYPSLFG